MTLSPALLILDIDETLLHAADEKLDRPEDFRVGPYWVYLRPGLSEFLAQVSSCYRLAVWTSSGSDYAAAMRSYFSPDLEFEFFWSRARCTRVFDGETMEYEWVKDLKKVRRQGFDLQRVLVVDDTPKKLSRNYGNLVRIPEFTGDLADEELLHLAEYLTGIKDVENFRDLEKRCWRSGRNH